MKHRKTGLYALIVASVMAVSFSSCKRTVGYCNCGGSKEGAEYDKDANPDTYYAKKALCNETPNTTWGSSGNCEWYEYKK